MVDASACEKGWNSLPSCSGVMPMPVSRTSKRSSARSSFALRDLLTRDDDLALLGELDGVDA